MSKEIKSDSITLFNRRYAIVTREAYIRQHFKIDKASARAEHGFFHLLHFPLNSPSPPLARRDIFVITSNAYLITRYDTNNIQQTTIFCSVLSQAIAAGETHVLRRSHFSQFCSPYPESFDRKIVRRKRARDSKTSGIGYLRKMRKNKLEASFSIFFTRKEFAGKERFCWRN